MILYPIIYIVLTLPLAAGRMAAMAGRTLPVAYYCVAGALLCSCGWLDTLLYTLTRRVFIKSEPQARTRSPTGTGSRNGSRRWHGRTLSKGAVAAKVPASDSDWPLSTFATVMGDFAGKEAEACGMQGGTAPGGEEGQMMATETTVRAGGEKGGEVEEDEQALIGAGIRSETRIEVTSVSRDEMVRRLEKS
jgi:hypothetical protein